MSPKQKRARFDLIVTVIIAIGALGYFALSGAERNHSEHSAGGEKRSADVSSTAAQSSPTGRTQPEPPNASQATRANWKLPEPQAAVQPAPLKPNGGFRAVTPEELPPDLRAQLEGPPPELPEDLKQQLNSP
ncbi:MAG: hypothetical protein KDD44_06895, partial [Bdellovibrionales bacterium]|nr:hypothetical protein [Bdellovibrionales bacterium]